MKIKKVTEKVYFKLVIYFSILLTCVITIVGWFKFGNKFDNVRPDFFNNYDAYELFRARDTDFIVFCAIIFCSIVLSCILLFISILVMHIFVIKEEEIQSGLGFDLFEALAEYIKLSQVILNKFRSSELTIDLIRLNFKELDFYTDEYINYLIEYCKDVETDLEVDFELLKSLKDYDIICERFLADFSGKVVTIKDFREKYKDLDYFTDEDIKNLIGYCNNTLVL